MAITYGFYNAINHDRAYNAMQMSQIFDGIINDGVYQSIGQKFAVTPGGGMVVNVGTGRAWFNHTWTLNDNAVPVVIPESHMAYARIDIVALEVNSNDSVRANSLKVISGLPAASPVAPALVHENGVYQYPLAQITVPAGASSIIAANITNKVGTSACPYVTGIIQTTSIDNLVAQWEAQFEAWFDHLQNELDENQAAHLQHQIDDLAETIPSKEEWITGTLDKDKWTVRISYQGIPTSYSYPLYEIVSSDYDVLDVVPDTNYSKSELEWRKLSLSPYNTSGSPQIWTINGVKPSRNINVYICRRKRG